MSFAEAKLLTRDQLIAELRKVAPGGKFADSTLKTWERRGMPVAVRHGRKIKLYRLSDIITWMERPAAA